jgi:integrase
MAIFTQQDVDALVAQYTASSKDRYVKDDALRGLELKLAKNTGRATWTVYGRIRNSKNQRKTLGKHPQMQIAGARSQAIYNLDQYDKGIDPIQQRRNAKQELLDDADIEKRRRTSLREMLDYHISVKNLKPKTAYDYRNTFKVCFPNWLDNPIQNIDEYDVENIYYRLKETGKLHQTEKAFTCLNALMNTAMNRAIGSTTRNSKRRRYLDENPVDILKGKRSTYITQKTRRTDVLHGGYEGRLDEFLHLLTTSEHPQWISSGGLDISPVFRDFAVVLLFTGIRMSEGLDLKWVDVHMDDPDPDRHYFQLHNTKNSSDFSVPISIPVSGALKSRKAARVSEWVFASFKNKGEHLTNPRKQWAKVSDWLGTKVTNHTMRRTFASAADLCGIPLETRARMLNHKTGSMTETYVINSVAALAPRFQDVADMIFKEPIHHLDRMEQPPEDDGDNF